MNFLLLEDLLPTSVHRRPGSGMCFQVTNVLIFSPIFVASEQVYHCFSTYLLVKFALGDFIFY